MGFLVVQLFVAGSNSKLIDSPKTYIFPSTEVALTPFSDWGICPLETQVFSSAVPPETGLVKIVDDAVRKTRTSAKAKALLIATTSLLDGLQIKDFSYKTLD